MTTMGSVGRVLNLVGEKFGRLEVLEFNHIKDGNAYWKCLCNCGNEKIIMGNNLRMGRTQSCGCYRKETSSKNSKKRIGILLSKEHKEKIGKAMKGKKLPPLSEETKRKISEALKGHIPWNKGISHSEETKRKMSKFMKGRFLGKDNAAYKHGDTTNYTKTRLYGIWSGMVHRCKDLNCKWYGNKGIEVCDEWKNFSIFKRWALSHGYTDNLCIDRIDPNGNYDPFNCQWITREENTRKMWRQLKPIKFKTLKRKEYK